MTRTLRPFLARYLPQVGCVPTRIGSRVHPLAERQFLISIFRMKRGMQDSELRLEHFTNELTFSPSCGVWGTGSLGPAPGALPFLTCLFRGAITIIIGLAIVASWLEKARVRRVDGYFRGDRHIHSWDGRWERSHEDCGVLKSCRRRESERAKVTPNH